MGNRKQGREWKKVNEKGGRGGEEKRGEEGTRGGEGVGEKKTMKKVEEGE